MFSAFHYPSEAYCARVIATLRYNYSRVNSTIYEYVTHIIIINIYARASA